MLVPPLSWFRAVASPPVPRPARPRDYFRQLASISASYWLGLSPRKIVEGELTPAELLAGLKRYGLDGRALLSAFEPAEPLWCSSATLHRDLSAALQGYTLQRGALHYARIVHAEVYGLRLPGALSRHAVWRASTRYQAGGEGLALAYDLACQVDPAELAGRGWAFSPWPDPWEATPGQRACAFALRDA